MWVQTGARLYCVHRLRLTRHLKTTFFIQHLKYALLFGAYFVLNLCAAQEDSLIRIIHADEWAFDKKARKDGQILKGAVHFLHKGADLYCDSALLFKKDNKVSAYGNVYVNQGDSLQLWGDEIQYLGNSGYLKIIASTGKKVKVETDSAFLYSPVIEYFRENDFLKYSRGGYLESKSGAAKLWSKNGKYFTEQKRIIFTDSVRLRHDDIDLRAKTLAFYPELDLAEFIDSTTIFLKDSTQGIHTTKGNYNLELNEGFFYDGSEWFSSTQSLKGDTLFIFNEGQNAWGKCNLILSDTLENILVYADSLYMEDAGKNASFYRGAWVEQQNNSDTLLIFSPRLDVVTDTLDQTTLTWFTPVKMFSSNFKALADTLIYSSADSCFSWIGNPVLWDATSQITGKKIQLFLKDGKPHRLYIPELGFMSSLVEPIGEFNQVSGKTITGYFHNNQLDSMLVEGNGESLYFAIDDKDSSLIGLNEAAGSSILIKLDSSKIKDIEFLTKPSSTMYPEKDIQTRKLKRFEWRGDEQPMRPSDIIFFDVPTKQDSIKAP